MPTRKQQRGQFYTTQSNYILEGLPRPPSDCRIVEPFAGQGDLIQWIKTLDPTRAVEAYDIEPKQEGIQQRDTLLHPPDYSDAWILTNPPYLARNKSPNKTLFDKYNTNDLYKCFLLSLLAQGPCRGGILILPAGFFFSPRDIDLRVREPFLRTYRLLKVKYFEEQVFGDTSTTVVAFAFERSPTPLGSQDVEWVRRPSGDSKIFRMASEYSWIVGGEIYSLPIPVGIKVRRHVEGQALATGEQQTFLTLNALDSGSIGGEISLDYKPGYIYPAQECSRTYATLRIQGRVLSENDQKKVSEAFINFIKQRRAETWSLFLPQFRESKEYARKRIPFELAYRIVLHLIHTQL